jgi:PleD family two-component response regulator
VNEVRVTGSKPLSQVPEALVLVVDDDEAARLTTTITLERAGYRVTEAGDCANARARFAEARPDIILLDVILTDVVSFSPNRAGEVCPLRWSPG